MKSKIWLAVLLWAPSFGAWAEDCGALEQRAQQMGVHIPSHESGRVTTGAGRVPFYSGPGNACKEKGVFVLTGETLDAYIEFGGFTLVLYINPKNGKEATGWVESTRLKETGTGIGPN